MVDNVDSTSNVAAMSVTVTNVGQAQKQNNGKADVSVSNQQPVKSVKLKITELANEAASDKESTVQSLDKLASELREAISALNAALEKAPTKAIITRDVDLNRYVVRIADKQSGEVVREIPSEALLKFARNLQELKGLIFDTSL